MSVSIFNRNFFMNLFKRVLLATYFRKERIVTIIRGPLKGCRYAANPLSGWASIYGGWEPAAQKAYTRMVEKDKVVYDLGANVGIHSLLFSKLVGPQGVVIAFEPLPENVREIESIKSLNAADNIRIAPVAAGNADGTVAFKIGKLGKQGSLTGIGCETGQEISVRVAKLDSLVAKEGYPLPDFVKMDIEGGEADAIEGMSAILDRCAPVFFIDLHTPEQDVRVAALLGDRGYTIHRLSEASSGPILMPIKNSRTGWPDPDGVWGTVVAVKEHVR